MHGIHNQGCKGQTNRAWGCKMGGKYIGVRGVVCEVCVRY